MQPASVAERDNLDVASRDKFPLQAFGMHSTALPACIELAWNDVNHHDPIRHGPDDRRRAAGRNQVDDSAAVRHQRQVRIS